MLEHFHKLARFGLILATVMLPMLTAERGKGIDLDQIADDLNRGNEMDANVFISNKSLTKLNKCLRDVIIDMVRLDYI